MGNDLYHRNAFKADTNAFYSAKVHKFFLYFSKFPDKENFCECAEILFFTFAAVFLSFVDFLN